MPALRVMGFDGVVPRTSSTMLAEKQAQVANNVKLYAQELRTWRGQSLTYSPPGGLPANIKTIYRHYGAAGSIWFTSAAVVDYVPGPIADIADYRAYYTGEATPRKTNWALANAATPFPSAYYEMGCPAPIAAATVASSSSANPVETRAYVYTYNNVFGAVTEESAPSPASALVNVDSGATVTINGFTAPPAGNYNWVSRNIYRSVTGATTSTYQFVATVALATASYVDSLTVAQLGNVLPTLGWLPPPAGLLGLRSMSCGSLVGFVGNTVWFSVPFYPHAWPTAYALSVAYPIIGVEVMDNAVVVMTTKFPYIISGALPGAMSEQILPLGQPCLNKSTIVSNELGVLYAGPDGLVSIGAGGVEIVTESLFQRDEWQASNPSYMKGVAFAGKYFGVYLAPYAANPTMILDHRTSPALSFLAMNAQCAFVDATTGNMFIVSTVDNNIYQVDADNLHPTPFTWTSKRFVNAHSVAMSALKVDADYSQITSTTVYNAAVAAVAAANATLFAQPTLGGLNTGPINTRQINGSTLASIPSFATTGNLQLYLFGDTVQICVITLTSFDPVRLPAFRAREIYFTLSGTLPVRSVEMATSVADLNAKAWAEAAAVPNLFQ